MVGLAFLVPVFTGGKQVFLTLLNSIRGDSMVKIIIINLIILLLQPVYVVDSIPTANQHYIMYFPNKREVFLYDLTNRTSKKIAEFREKGFEIDFGSVKYTDNKIYLSTQNRNNVHFGYVPDSNYTLQFQKGNMVQKDYIVSIDGNCKYIKMRETKALNNEMIEIKETNFDSKAEITEIKIWRERNRRSFISPILFKCIEKNGIKLIVDKRSLYMEKKQGERQCLINSDKKISYKVAYGCMTLQLTKKG